MYKIDTTRPLRMQVPNGRTIIHAAHLDTEEEDSSLLIVYKLDSGQLATGYRYPDGRLWAKGKSKYDIVYDESANKQKDIDKLVDDTIAVFKKKLGNIIGGDV